MQQKFRCQQYQMYITTLKCVETKPNAYNRNQMRIIQTKCV